jgi:hypothetical protein
MSISRSDPRTALDFLEVIKDITGKCAQCIVRQDQKRTPQERGFDVNPVKHITFFSGVRID